MAALGTVVRTLNEWQTVGTSTWCRQAGGQAYCRPPYGAYHFDWLQAPPRHIITVDGRRRSVASGHQLQDVAVLFSSSAVWPSHRRTLPPLLLRDFTQRFVRDSVQTVGGLVSAVSCIRSPRPSRLLTFYRPCHCVPFVSLWSQILRNFYFDE